MPQGAPNSAYVDGMQEDNEYFHGIKYRRYRPVSSAYPNGYKTETGKCLPEKTFAARILPINELKRIYPERWID